MDNPTDFCLFRADSAAFLSSVSCMPRPVFSVREAAASVFRPFRKGIASHNLLQSPVCVQICPENLRTFPGFPGLSVKNDGIIDPLAVLETGSGISEEILKF